MLHFSLRFIFLSFESFLLKYLSFEVVGVGDEIVCDVESVGVLGVLLGVEKVAADEGGVMVVGVGFAFFVGTVERCADISFLGLLVEVDGSLL